MVAEAATTAELARVMAVHRPDVVVLDDGIGAVAVGMINEMSPATDVILVWPGAVMPVGGAARVEPSRVLQDLGPAVESLTGQPCASTSGSGAALLDRAANDPDVLRAMLLGGAAAAAAAADEPIIEDREPAPVVILPVTPTVERDGILQVPEAGSEDDEPTRAPGRRSPAASSPAATLGGTAAAAEAGGSGAAAAGAAAREPASAPERPQSQAGEPRPGRRAASALVIALALGGAKIPVDGIRGSAPITSSQSPGPPAPPGGDAGENPGVGPDGGNPDGQTDGLGGEVFTRTGGSDVPTLTIDRPTRTDRPTRRQCGTGDIGPGTGGSDDEEPGRRREPHRRRR